jgi:hypothetical protein
VWERTIFPAAFAKNENSIKSQEQQLPTAWPEMSGKHLSYRIEQQQI